MDGISVAWLPSRKLLGLIAPWLDGSALTGVKGRELSAYSTRKKEVFKTSSVRQRVPRLVKVFS